MFNDVERRKGNMKTNELEKEIGLSKYTIRYYEKEGLIQPKREENGYRDYDDETVQKLKIIKFLRNLQISVDDIKAILEGELDFRHCLKINQVNMQKQIESMNEIKDTIDDYYDKDLPLIEELSEIKNNNNKIPLLLFYNYSYEMQYKKLKNLNYFFKCLKNLSK